MLSPPFYKSVWPLPLRKVQFQRLQLRHVGVDVSQPGDVAAVAHVRGRYLVGVDFVVGAACRFALRCERFLREFDRADTHAGRPDFGRVLHACG